MTAYLMQEPTAQCNREVHCKHTCMLIEGHTKDTCVSQICVYVFVFEQRFGFLLTCVFMLAKAAVTAGWDFIKEL